MKSIVLNEQGPSYKWAFVRTYIAHECSLTVREFDAKYPWARDRWRTEQRKEVTIREIEKSTPVPEDVLDDLDQFVTSIGAMES